MDFLLAHFSDPHLGPLPPLKWRSLMNKRFTGYMNWRYGRAHQNNMEILAALVEDVHQQEAQHIAVTGDIVNLSLTEEFKNARRWLLSLGLPEKVSFVPGNHDIYIPGVQTDLKHYLGDFYTSDKTFPYNRPLSKLTYGREGPGDLGAQDRSVLNVHEDLSTKSTQQFSPELGFQKRSNDFSLFPKSRRPYRDFTNKESHPRKGEVLPFLPSLPPWESGDFPYLRIRPPLALIGVSSALPTAPLMASGYVSSNQLERLEEILQYTHQQNFIRILLIHHPPYRGSVGPRRILMNAKALQKILSLYGAELILHGHNHRFSLRYLSSPKNPIPIIGVPSASHCGGAGYHLFYIQHNASKGFWRITGESRSFSLSQGLSVQLIGTWQISK